jgi:hypothetical protein
MVVIGVVRCRYDRGDVIVGHPVHRTYRITPQTVQQFGVHSKKVYIYFLTHGAGFKWVFGAKRHGHTRYCGAQV